MQSYQNFVTHFNLEKLYPLLGGNPADGMNVCHQCCDRHVDTGRVAVFWEGEEGARSSQTFEDLRQGSARFARFLESQGVRPGDRVACLLPRVPELFVAALGTWRAGAVYVPLFTAFGPKAIDFRLRQSQARLIVTDTSQREKLETLADCPPIVTLARNGSSVARSDLDLRKELEGHPADFSPVELQADDPFLLLFTSGTTGEPKGVPVPVRALLSFLVYMKYAVGLTREDSYWNVADPGWAYGLYYAVVGPLLMGCSTHFYEGSFDPESTYRVLDRYGITRMAAAPTAYRMLKGAGPPPAGLDLRLREACSAGEPLNPEVIRWMQETLNCRVLDHYGQTEIAMVVCNHHALEHSVIPGSMGLPMPGFRMVAIDDEGREVGSGETGQLVLDRRQSPLDWFQGYWKRDTSERYLGPYYLTGDWVEVGPEGHLTFVGRRDDLITTAGYRVGPFDVESTLIEHPSVAESAVIGKPDPERGETVMAFVVLREGVEPSPRLLADLQQFVRKRLSAHAYPREIAFVETLPKTPSGKIQRFLLRQQASETSP